MNLVEERTLNLARFSRKRSCCGTGLEILL